jgi:WD40 repeat protein/tRNA A-37 threonylcarbamoyl transferase component Bud32
MPPSIACVGEEELRAYLVGDLGEERAGAVARHLEECPSCEAEAGRLDGLADPLLLSLRRALRSPSANSSAGPAAETLGEKSGDAASLPRRVKGYEILGKLGSGGMGVVYKARQERPARLVALKMILAGSHVSAERRARLLADANAIARLQHPNIVQVYEVGEEDDVPFFSMELVEGGDLEARLAKTPQPPRQAAGLVRMLAAAVSHAHDRKVIHRDLKPGNVLLAGPPASPLDRCTPKITDFGLAKQLDEAPRTISGTILGTPSYMAPEQAEARNEVGPLADVYSLGAILYECLTGRPPFLAATVLETLEQVKTREPLPPSQLQPKVPRDLNTICLKCLHKQTQGRYASAAELADDLGRFLNNEPIRARPVGLLERSWRWGRRNPGWAAALLLLLLVTTGSLLAAWRLYAMTVDLKTAERSAEEQLLESLLAQARGNQTSGRPGQRFESLEALRQAARLARRLGKGEETILALRNQAIACMALPDIRVLKQWEGNPPGTIGLAFDDGFTRYAQASVNGVSVRRLSDHEELFLLSLLPLPQAYPWVRLRFSPTGRFLAVDYYMSSPRGLQVWELKPGPTKPWVLDKVSGGPCFSPDEKALAVGLTDGAVSLRDPASGEEIRRLPPGVPAESLAFRPDGKALAIANSTQPEVQIRELPSGKIVRTLKHEAGVLAVAWRPTTGTEEGSKLPLPPSPTVQPLLATGCYDQRIYLWEAHESASPRFLEGHGWEIAQLTFDATGHRLLSFGWDMTLRLWDVPARRLMLTVPEVQSAGFSTREGLRAACLQGKQVKVLSVVTEGVVAALHGEPHRVFQMAFHPIHDWLASTGAWGNARLWDAARGSELTWFPPPKKWGVLWEPFGDALLINQETGLRRWPVQVQHGTDGARVRVGPPAHPLGPSKPIIGDRMAWCGPGADLLLTSHQGPEVSLFRFGPGGGKVRTFPEPKVELFSPSPDGRWLATAGYFQGRGFTLWEVASGKRLKEVKCGNAEVAFTPDGRWLIFATGKLSREGTAAVHSWEVGTWKERKSVLLNRPSSAAPPMTIAPDSRMLAVSSTMTEVRLMNPDTLDEIATLVAPDPQLISWLTFNTDGSRLAAATGKTIHLWDLKAVRQSLRELRLDWGGKDYPARKAPPAWRVEVDPGPDEK